MYELFRAIIKRNRFIREGGGVVAGVSGGVDSMVLAALLIRLRKDIPFKPALAHVNYKLRGKESDAQEKLVRDFSRKNGIDCFSTEARLSSKMPENFQKAARDFRYHYFAEVAASTGAKKIAVAHHRDDQVETVLAHLLRGSSLKGLSGMKKSRPLLETADLSLIRPLLTFAKADLMAYARENDIPFIEDSSNESPEYWRNRLRHELLPVVDALRPKSFEKIVRLADAMRELSDFLAGMAQEWLEAYGKKENGSFWLPRPRFQKLPKTLRFEILREAFAACAGIAAELKQDHLSRCDRILTGNRSDARYCLPEGWQFRRVGEDLVFCRLFN